MAPDWILLALLQTPLPAGPAPSIRLGPDRTKTLEGETDAAGYFNCRLTADDDRAFTLTMTHKGERGYLNPITGAIVQTDPEIEVRTDPERLLRGFRFELRKDLTYIGYSDEVTSALGKQVELTLSRTSDPRRSDVYRFAMRLDAYWDWMPLTKAVGFCDLRLEPQRPLTPAEAKTYLSKRKRTPH